MGEAMTEPCVTTRHAIDLPGGRLDYQDRKSTRLNSSHLVISYAVFCLKKKKKTQTISYVQDRDWSSRSTESSRTTCSLKREMTNTTSGAQRADTMSRAVAASDKTKNSQFI